VSGRDAQTSARRLAPGQTLTVLYQVMAEHLETFLAQLHASNHQRPSHVEHELGACPACGLLAHGFLRVRCQDCGTSRVVAFAPNAAARAASQPGRRVGSRPAWGGSSGSRLCYWRGRRRGSSYR
jgi:hypothetical protein